MARTVTVRDAEGNPFACTRTQWERIHQPNGLTLIADENGDPERRPRTTRKPEPDNTGD